MEDWWFDKEYQQPWTLNDFIGYQTNAQEFQADSSSEPSPTTEPYYFYEQRKQKPNPINNPKQNRIPFPSYSVKDPYYVSQPQIDETVQTDPISSDISQPSPYLLNYQWDWDSQTTHHTGIGSDYPPRPPTLYQPQTPNQNTQAPYSYQQWDHFEFAEPESSTENTENTGTAYQTAELQKGEYYNNYGCNVFISPAVAVCNIFF